MRKWLLLAAIVVVLAGNIVQAQESDAINCVLQREAEPGYETYLTFGDEARDAGDFEQAKVYYTCAVQTLPNEVEAYRRRGKLYLDKIRDYSLAVTDYSRVIELAPEDTVAFHNRGLAYFWLLDYQKAIDDYTRALALDPTYALAYNSRGLARTNREDYQGAIADFTAAIRYDTPDDKLPLEWPYNNMGIAFLRDNQWQKAVTNYEKAIEINPAYAEPFLRLADVYYAQGQFNDALEHYRTYLTLAGSNPRQHAVARVEELDQQTDWVRILPTVVIALIVLLAVAGTATALWQRWKPSPPSNPKNQRQSLTSPQKLGLEAERALPVASDSQPIHVAPIPARQERAPIPLRLILLPIVVMATSAIAYLLARGKEGRD